MIQVCLQIAQCPSKNKLLLPGIFTLTHGKMAVQKLKRWVERESVGRTLTTSYRYEMKHSLWHQPNQLS